MIVYAFPGQGSHSPGMGLDLAAHFPVFHALADEASEVLGFDLAALVKEGGDRLNQTMYTQPALLWAGYAAFVAWRQHGGPAPDLLCGHSLGEYTALVAAEVLDYADAIRLVHQRGQLMQQQVAPQESLMAAIIGLEDQQVIDICTELCAEAKDPQALSPANFNAKGQVVVAGKATALASLQVKAQAAGARRVLPLTMSVPSHCALMEGARVQLAEFAQSIKFAAAQTPIVQNLDATARTDATEIKTALINQLTGSVRWRQTLATFTDASEFIESGPGSVLQGLAKRALPDTRLHGIGSATAFATAAHSFRLAVLQ